MTTTTAPLARPETALAIEAARAGLHRARYGGGAADIRLKGPRDVVTAADIAVEDTVRGVLSAPPGHAVIGEERGGAVPAGGLPYWLVDPICGTRNFASGIPLYCVNLALVEDGLVTVAASADASTGEVLAAERGRGAWARRDGGWHRLTVDQRNGVVSIQDGHSRGERRERAARCVAAAIRAAHWDVRALGSTISLPYVAAGRIAGYLEFFGQALHTAAGSLLATEAGGVVTDIDGRPWRVGSDSIVASASPDLHRKLLAMAGAPATAHNQAL